MPDGSAALPRIHLWDSLLHHVNSDWDSDAGHKYCRMLQREHSKILSASIKLPFSIKTLVLSIFKWPLKRQALL